MSPHGVSAARRGGDFADSDLAVSAPLVSLVWVSQHESAAAEALSFWTSRPVRLLRVDDLTRQLLLAGRKLVDSARYLFLTGAGIVTIRSAMRAIICSILSGTIRATGACGANQPSSGDQLAMFRLATPL